MPKKQDISSLAKPVAILVLYEPGHRFKLKKYYLKAGKNYIGSHTRSDILIEGAGSTAAIITITQQLIFIQTYEPGAVHIPSNLIKKPNLMVQLQREVRYIVEMQKDFIICRHKALMQILSLPDLLRVKGVQNQSLFMKNIKDDGNFSENSSKTEKLEIQNFEGTLPLEEEPYNFEATVPLAEDYNFQATLPIQNNNYDATIPLDGGSYDPTLLLQQNNNFQPTLLLDINDQDDPFSRNSQNKSNHKNQESQIENRVFLKSQSRRIINPSQFAAMNASLPSEEFQKQSQIESKKKCQSFGGSPKKNNHEEEGEEFSMPETIKEDEMPGTIRDDQDMMPATIQEDKSSSRKKYEKKLTMSMPLQRISTEASKFKKFSSYPVEKTEEKPINDFEELFGSVEQQPLAQTFSSKLNMNFTESNNKKQQQNKEQHSQTQKLSQQRNLSSIKKQSMKAQQSEKKSDKKNDKKDRKKIKCGVVCCRREEIKNKELEEKGYKIVDDPHEQFQVLFVGSNGLKLSKRLMLSLIEGKQIKSINWVVNPHAKIIGKLQGFPWEMIEKRKGKKQEIFKGKYYLQEQLQQEFKEVMIKGGAQILQQLKKSHSRSNISILINQKSEQGKELYHEKKTYKKWKFYKKRMIIESVLMGEEIKEKYEIEEYEL